MAEPSQPIERTHRPVGVSLLALTAAVIGVLYFSLALVANLILIASLGGFSSAAASLASIILGVVILFPILLIAAGFWRGWPTALWLMAFVMVVLTGLGGFSILSALGFGSASILSLSESGTPLQFFIASLSLGLPLLAYLYLLRGRVRICFQLQATSKARATVLLLVAVVVFGLAVMTAGGL